VTPAIDAGRLALRQSMAGVTAVGIAAFIGLDWVSLDFCAHRSRMGR